jgi:hypothetical protein
MSARPPELQNAELVSTRVKPIGHTGIPRPDNDAKHAVGVQASLPIVKAALRVGSPSSLARNIAAAARFPPADIPPTTMLEAPHCWSSHA